MSDLIVIGFENKFRADEVSNKLLQMEKGHLVDLEDSAIVIRNENGKVKIKQSQNLVASGFVGGTFWGFFIGLLFFHPLAGILIGAASGALGGSFSDIGVNDDFIKDIGNTIKPGTSAIFVLLRNSTTDKFTDELKKYGGRILHTSLSKADEKEIKEALESELEG